MASKEEIKNAAFILFANKGYDSTSMQDIANAVGLKKQSLYSHFSCKQDIYESILKEQMADIMSKLCEAFNSLIHGSTEAVFKGFFRSLIDVFSCRERLLLWKRGFYIDGGNETSSRIAVANWHFDKRLIDKLYENMKGKNEKLADPKAFRSFFISFMLCVQGYFDWMATMGHDEAVFESYWHHIWNGIALCF